MCLMFINFKLKRACNNLMATHGAMGSFNMYLPRGRLMKCHSMLFVTPDTLNTQFNSMGKKERENNAKGSRDHRV